MQEPSFKAINWLFLNVRTQPITRTSVLNEVLFNKSLIFSLLIMLYAVKVSKITILRYFLELVLRSDDFIFFSST
jgi:hypothetical protein